MGTNKYWSLINIVTVFLLILCVCIFMNNSSSISAPCDKASYTNNTIVIKPYNRHYNRLPTEDNEAFRRDFMALSDRKAAPDDPDLIRLVRTAMDKPSNKSIIKIHKYKVVQTPQATAVDAILKQKKHGFFVECGAFDGETSSNTVFLETTRQWTGLMVEMDPYFYTQLMGKNRNVFSVNMCLSPHPYPTMIEYKESDGQLGEISLDTHNTSTNESYPKSGHESRLVQAPCVPPETLFRSINRTHIDYFSLDVEGFELDILQNIPFDLLDISVFSVEHKHVRQGKEAIKTYMEDHGYLTHEDIHHVNRELSIYVDDFIFVKKTFANENVITDSEADKKPTAKNRGKLYRKRKT